MDNINLQSSAPKNVINVTSDTSVYYANIAKEAANSASESAQLAADKAQIVQNGVQSALNEIEELKTESLSSIETLSESSKNELNTTKASSIIEVVSAKTTALESIEQAEVGALSLIESAYANFANKDLSNITDDGKNLIRTLASEGSTPGSGGGGGGSWGSITGTLSDQTDLSEVLATKLNADYTNSTMPYLLEFGTSFTYRYRKWSNGYLEQMGTGAVAENDTLWIDLPFSYTNSSYIFLVSPQYTDLVYDSSTPESDLISYNVWVNTRENDCFCVTNCGPYATIGWYTCGKY